MKKIRSKYNMFSKVINELITVEAIRFRCPSINMLHIGILLEVNRDNNFLDQIFLIMNTPDRNRKVITFSNDWRIKRFKVWSDIEKSLFKIEHDIT